MLPLNWKTIPLSTVPTHGGRVADIDGIYVIFDEIGVLSVGKAKSVQRDVIALCHSANLETYRDGGQISCSFAPIHPLLRDSAERYLFDALEPVLPRPQPEALPREVRLPYELSYVIRERLDALSVAEILPSYSFAP